MVVLGAGRHATEILDVLEYNNEYSKEIVFFDNSSNYGPNAYFKDYRIIRNLDMLRSHFEENRDFILGVGNPKVRMALGAIGKDHGGQLHSIISKTALIGNNEVHLSEGLNIMHNVMISSYSRIGVGTLINARTNIHHDCQIGEYCEIGPGCTITGNVEIGNYCSLGAGVTIIPNIKVGSNVKIGAGAVVTTDLKDNTLYVGIPAKEQGSSLT